MLYINVAKVRKLVGVRRIKRWVQPGETIDLDASDIRMLGANAAYIVLYTEDTEDLAKETDSADEATKKDQEKEDKKKLAESLKGCRKDRLIEIAEGILGLDVLSKSKKNDIIKEIMKEAKKKGYAWVLANS